MPIRVGTPVTTAVDTITTSPIFNIQNTGNIGDLLVLHLRGGSNMVISDPPNAIPGWTFIHPVATTNSSGYIFARVADNTEAATVSITTTQEVYYTSICSRYRSWHGVLAGGIEVVSSFSADLVSHSTVDPLALTPSWGSAENLWVAGISGRETTYTLTSPTNYGSSVTIKNAGTTIFNTTTSEAIRVFEGTSEDPGVWTIDPATDGRFGFFTMAIRPGTSGERVPRRLANFHQGTGVGTTVCTTNSVSPSPNSLVILYFFGNQAASTITSEFATVNGWTSQGAMTNQSNTNISVSWAVTTDNPGSGTITATSNSATLSWFDGFIVEQLTFGFNRHDPIRAIITGANGVNTTSLTPIGTFDEIPASPSLLVGAITARKVVGSVSTIIDSPAVGLTAVGTGDLGAHWGNSMASLYGPGTHGSTIGWTLTEAPSLSSIVGLEIRPDQFSIPVSDLTDLTDFTARNPGVTDNLSLSSYDGQPTIAMTRGNNAGDVFSYDPAGTSANMEILVEMIEPEIQTSWARGVAVLINSAQDYGIGSGTSGDGSDLYLGRCHPYTNLAGGNTSGANLVRHYRLLRATQLGGGETLLQTYVWPVANGQTIPATPTSSHTIVDGSMVLAGYAGLFRFIGTVEPAHYFYIGIGMDGATAPFPQPKHPYIVGDISPICTANFSLSGADVILTYPAGEVGDLLVAYYFGSNGGASTSFEFVDLTTPVDWDTNFIKTGQDSLTILTKIADSAAAGSVTITVADGVDGRMAAIAYRVRNHGYTASTDVLYDISLNGASSPAITVDPNPNNSLVFLSGNSWYWDPAPGHQFIGVLPPTGFTIDASAELPVNSFYSIFASGIQPSGLQGPFVWSESIIGRWSSIAIPAAEPSYPYIIGDPGVSVVRSADSSLNYPAGEVGDLLIAVYNCWQGVENTPPVGWDSTQILLDLTTLEIVAKIADSADAGNLTRTIGSELISSAIYRIRNHGYTSISDIRYARSFNGTDSPSLSNTLNNNLTIIGVQEQNTLGGLTSINVPAGFTQDLFVDSGGDPSVFGLVHASSVQSGDTIGPFTWSNSVIGQFFSLSILPAQEATGLTITNVTDGVDSIFTVGQLGVLIIGTGFGTQ